MVYDVSWTVEAYSYTIKKETLSTKIVLNFLVKADL